MIRRAAGEVRKLLIGLGAVVVGLALLIGIVAVGAKVLGGDDTDAYCDAVAGHQASLSEIVASGDKDALIQALPDLRAIAAQAPEDIAPSWETVIGAVEDLGTAVASKDEAAIKGAATALTADDVTAAMAAVQQQVRDVCHTPLTL